MTTSLALLALLLKATGLFFLLAAGIGLLRFRDPLQRMHAATKAATLGAGFIVAGTITPPDSMLHFALGLLTIALLLATAPVAGHVLGRAIYRSGISLTGIEGPADALEGVLARDGRSTPCVSAENEVEPVSISSVRCPVTKREDLMQRAVEVAGRAGLPVEARAILTPIRSQGTSAALDARLREEWANLVARIKKFEDHAARKHVKASLFYAEGKVSSFLPSSNPATLLMLSMREPLAAGGKSDIRMHQEQMFDVAAAHAGPILFVFDACSDPNAIQNVCLDFPATGPVAGTVARAVDAGLWGPLGVLSPDASNGVPGSGFDPRLDRLSRGLDDLASLDSLNDLTGEGRISVLATHTRSRLWRRVLKDVEDGLLIRFKGEILLIRTS